MEEKQILIVEDECMIANDIRDILNLNDFTNIKIVAYGEKAVLNAKKERPDLVIMDIRLKGPMNGINAAIKIGEMYDFLVPIIYLTKEKDPLIVEYASRDNNKFSDYFNKPVDEELLPITVERMILEAEREQARLAEVERQKEIEKELYEKMKNVRDSFFVNAKGDEQKQINVKDVLFIETDKRGAGALIIANDKEYTLDKNLTKFLNEFPHKNLIRIHTSYIVNTTYIDKYKKNEYVLLKNFDTITRKTHNNMRFFVNNKDEKWNGIISIGKKYRGNINDLL